MTDMKERKSNHVGLAFGLGLIAGGALGYFLATDKGQEMTRQAGERIREIGDDVSSQAKEKLNQFSGSLEEAYEKGKEYAEEMRTSIKRNTNKAAGEVDQLVSGAIDSFKRGMEKAADKKVETDKA